MQVTISIRGVYDWDHTIFDELQLPQVLNRDDLINDILWQCAELELLYSAPGYLKSAIGRWSRRRLAIWEHLWSTTQYDYNPIENYDRYEEWNDDVKETGNNDNNETRHGTGNAESSQNGNVLNKVAGFNNTSTTENDLVSESSSETSTSSNNNASTNEEISRNMTEQKDSQSNHKGYTHGNIGVTTTQQMITQERQIADFDLYQLIIDEFKNTFCLGVY